MAKRKFQLSNQQVKKLKHAYSDCDDGLTRTRYQAVCLYGTNYPVEQVMEITGCSRTSLLDWCRIYSEKGLSALGDCRNGGNRAKLKNGQIQELAACLQSYRPADLFGLTAVNGQYWTVADLQRAVQLWFGVTYRSSSSYHRLFRLCNFSYQHGTKSYRKEG
ncbi:winged helix-turn-helix domain-containing protein [Anaerolineales bacterium HSG24]|nr:winged helix-turn-helix domain-containing protein [Anaerolineales bacterium HSG24]